jgi:hypothetical protein
MKTKIKAHDLFQTDLMGQLLLSRGYCSVACARRRKAASHQIIARTLNGLQRVFERDFDLY